MIFHSLSRSYFSLYLARFISLSPVHVLMRVHTLKRTHTHSNTQTHKHTDIQTHIYTHVNVNAACKCTCARAHTHTCTHWHTHTNVHTLQRDRGTAKRTSYPFCPSLLPSPAFFFLMHTLLDVQGLRGEANTSKFSNSSCFFRSVSCVCANVRGCVRACARACMCVYVVVYI